MFKVILFAGTTEGRMIGEFLGVNSVSTLVCTATEYGGSLMKAGPSLTVREERLNEEEMAALFREETPELVIDATHPYAQDVTKNIKGAAAAAGCEYLRVLRQGLNGDGGDSAVYVGTVDEAVNYLQNTSGRILATTGSKEIAKYAAIEDYQNRVVARVLSTPESMKLCSDAGFAGKNLICMQGPFSKEMNVALLHQFDCKYLVTKISGSTGGFEDKIQAAWECQVTPVIVGVPVQEEGYTLEECMTALKDRFTINNLQYISLVGIGMGDVGSLTMAGKRAIDDAQLVIGAGRMLASFDLSGKEVLKEYDSGRICRYIEEHPQYERIAVLLSGDSGFYSGARKLVPLLEEAGCQVAQLPGISSLSCFFSKIGMAWDDAVIVSNHGMGTSLIPLIRDHYKTFSILGKRDDVKTLADKLVRYGLDHVEIHVGERLSYEDEVLSSGSPSDYLNYENDPLCVICIINDRWQETRINTGRCRRDDEFIRGKVPMTKEEIRTLSIDRLELDADSVCYDVGAGTGSVTIDMALKASQGKVYAIEKKEEAVRLIEENKIRFMADNIEVIAGLAPEAMEDLPAPTHVFIGGSSGNMDAIIGRCLEKNPHARFVINCIALESVGQAVECANKYSEHAEIMQIQASRGRKIGSYTLMTGENPITIIAFGGEENR